MYTGMEEIIQGRCEERQIAGVRKKFVPARRHDRGSLEESPLVEDVALNRLPRPKYPSH
jgi:hypothetical protein